MSLRNAGVACPRANVHHLERMATGTIGAWLLWSYARSRIRAGRTGAVRDRPASSSPQVMPWVAGALLVRAVTGYCPVYGALGSSRRTDTRRALSGRHGIHVRESVTVARRPHEVFAIWRQLEHLPLFMPHLESVTELDERRSRWVTRPVAGMRFEWIAEIIDEVEGEHIGWRSIPGSDVVSAGSVHFRPVAEILGTEVRVALQYAPPGGQLGSALAALLGDHPAAQIREDLERFKRMLETDALALSGTPNS
jgi:uncharacterized membrane protein